MFAVPKTRLSLSLSSACVLICPHVSSLSAPAAPVRSPATQKPFNPLTDVPPVDSDEEDMARLPKSTGFVVEKPKKSKKEKKEKKEAKRAKKDAKKMKKMKKEHKK